LSGHDLYTIKKNKESNYDRHKRFKSELLATVRFFPGRYIKSITGSEGKDISKARFAKDITKAVLSVITECQECKIQCINDISGSFEGENRKEIKKIARNSLSQSEQAPGYLPLRNK